jgi:L-fucose mutarotase
LPLDYRILHPQLLHALARAGHGARILVADANYPASTQAPPRAETVYLNVCPGLLDVPTVLTVLTGAMSFEAATVMVADHGEVSPAVAAMQEHLPAVEWEHLSRQDFYRAARSDGTSLVIATGEQQLYANVLLTVGTRRHGLEMNGSTQ